MKVDLHVHTNASDGVLSTSEILVRAYEQGVTHLSITDHDTLAAYQSVDAALLNGIQLTVGVEFSTVWNGVGVHILGYAFNPGHDVITELLAYQARCRSARVHTIAERLERQGIAGSLEWLEQQYPNTQIGRPHFAQFMVEQGIVPDSGKAFKKYLGAGKIGDVKQDWAMFTDIIQTIITAGGVAVLAHPGQYRLTNAKLKRLLHDFRAAGGRGMEVVSGRQTADRTMYMSQLCQALDLLASTGSDFHSPDVPWREIGAQSPLPVSCQPVWQAFSSHTDV